MSFYEIALAYRDAKDTDELKQIARQNWPKLKKLLQDDRGCGLAAIESYMYFHKKITGEPLGTSTFLGKPRQEFIENILSKVEAA